MDVSYLKEVASQLGISIFIFAIILIWSAVWKFLALWKAGRKNSPIWFVVLALTNTVGILDILYIYAFSEKRKKQSSSRTRRKRRR